MFPLAFTFARSEHRLRVVFWDAANDVETHYYGWTTYTELKVSGVAFAFQITIGKCARTLRTYSHLANLEVQAKKIKEKRQTSFPLLLSVNGP